MISVGIDLGTTNTVVCIMTESGETEFLEADGGMQMTPSAVSLGDDNGVIVGAAAKHRVITQPDRTHTKFKRAIGTEKKFLLGKNKFSATDLSAFLLKQLKADIEAKYQDEIGEVVISVPAYFNSVQRSETLLAGEIAGFKVSRLINEPTAAALAYGLQDRTGESQFIVLDLGGGTFDVSILEMFEGVMEVRASSGDAFLGGEDFTETVAMHFAKKLDVDWAKAKLAQRETFYSAAEEMKKQLSFQDNVTVRVPLDGVEQELTMTVTEFDEICKPIALRIRRPIERCLYDAKLTPQDMDRIVLVGGATRMTAVRSLAARMFQKLPERSIDPDLIVAHGAAIQAGLSQKNAALDDMVMTDVSPFSLGIKSRNETPHGVIENAFVPVIERNTILPASRVSYFSTIQNNQTSISVQIYQGESPMADENVKLGAMSVTVPSAPAKHENIEVRFSYDVSGLLQVEVKVVSTGRMYDIVIEGSASSLSPEEKAKRLKALESYKVSPREDRENQAILEALKHLYAMHLGDDRMLIADLIAQFETVMNGQDPKEIAIARQNLAEQITTIEQNFVT
jgi:molecular chaperone HscC